MSLIKDLDFNGTQGNPFFNNDSLMDSNISFLSALKGRNFTLGLKRHGTDLVFKLTCVHVEVAWRKKKRFQFESAFSAN